MTHSPFRLEHRLLQMPSPAEQHAHRRALFQRMSRSMFRFVCCFILTGIVLVGLGVPGRCFAQKDERLTDIMYLDPPLPQPVRHLVLPERLRRPWLAALERPEVEVQRIVIDSMAMAHGLGMEDWDDVIERLVELLQADETDPTLRRAAANTLVTLDARRAADALFEAASGTHLGIAQLAEPALARWDYAAAKPVWNARLRDPQVSRARLVLAMNALAECGDTAAAESLLSIVQDVTRPVTVRLSAARAVARLQVPQCGQVAEQLAGQAPMIERLLAVNLLSHTQDARTLAALKQLATDSVAPVAGAALRRLYDLDPVNVAPFIADSIQRPDVNIRRVVAETLVHQASPESIQMLRMLLGDHNPSLRRYCSNSLIALGQDEKLTASVFEAIEETLAGDDWRALEQSAFVVGGLDMESAGPRLLELLNHRRHEVQGTSAWALRKIAVPELFPPMLEHAQTQYQLALKDSSQANIFWDTQVSQIVQCFGEVRYRKAEPLMRELVKKKMEVLYTSSRVAGIWSLGYLYEDQSPQALAKEIGQRLADIESTTPEFDPLRRVCAVSLGRMNAKSEMPVLERFAGDRGLAGSACRWAVAEITNTPMVIEPDETVDHVDWFLSPLK